MWTLVNSILKLWCVSIATSTINFTWQREWEGGRGMFIQVHSIQGGRLKSCMVALQRQKGLKRRWGSSDCGVRETVGLLTPSTVPYGSSIRFLWTNRVRTEEHPLPQCVHTSSTLAPPPWGPAVPSGPLWTYAPPKRKGDCSPKGRNNFKDLAL